MTQREIHLAVARATGDTLRTVADRGFQIEDRPPMILDPDTLEVYSLDELEDHILF